MPNKPLTLVTGLKISVIKTKAYATPPDEEAPSEATTVLVGQYFCLVEKQILEQS
ncbi:hypothetical protein HB777_29960 [Mesorhizobium loti]|nr:hypothetical protein HB777_29960 [Mesorhizobium loti]